HIDHIRRHTDGGPTSMDNGQGLCASCNYLKEHPDWHTRRDTSSDHSGSGGSGRHTVSTTTPTGHAYTSTPPPLPLPTINPRQHSDLEHRIITLLKSA
ncbi:HNH endonuclease, partial [Calidifontibacter sp. DB2511S]|nr:HNH endonuclease [Calidifontibacter sp. DB2511S]